MFILLSAILLAMDPSSELQRGRALAAGGDIDAAISCFQRTARDFPGWGLVQLELADLLSSSRPDSSELEQALVAARSLEPLNPRAWLISGRYYERRNQYEAAIDAYSQAVNLRPELVEGRDRLGALLVENKRCAEAVPHLVAFLRTRPNEHSSRLYLSRAYECDGDLKSAEKELRSLIASVPQSLAYRRQLESFLERSGRSGPARDLQRPTANRPPTKKMRPLPPSTR